MSGHAPLLAELRERVAHLDGSGVRARPSLPFGVEVIDRHLPGGGLLRGALHEVSGVGEDFTHGAAAALFIAGVLARLDGPVLWCLRRRDLFAPGLANAGLDPDRVIYAEAGDAKNVLLAMEEGLRHAPLAGVVGEIDRIGLTASRRLNLAAEASGVAAFALKRGWRPGDVERGAERRAHPAGGSPPCRPARSRCRGSGARSGGWNSPVAAMAKRRSGLWRRAMNKAVSHWQTSGSKIGGSKIGAGNHRAGSSRCSCRAFRPTGCAPIAAQACRRWGCRSSPPGVTARGASCARSMPRHARPGSMSACRWRRRRPCCLGSLWSRPSRSVTGKRSMRSPSRYCAAPARW